MFATAVIIINNKNIIKIRKKFVFHDQYKTCFVINHTK